MELELIFKILVGFTIIQRLAELFLAKSNEAYIKSHGGKVLKESNYIFMVLLHSTWLVSLVGAIYLKKLEINVTFFVVGLLLFILGQILRVGAIATLGKRWSTRVMVLPQAEVVSKGLFRYVRHPNYLGVVLEIFALPLIAGLWELSLIFSFLNAIVLFFRIRFEEKMLTKYNNYDQTFLKSST